MNPALGPSCLNLYEEANTDRPRLVGFDLEFELGHALKDGTLDHKARAAALWPDDYAAVAASAELFLSRALVDRILPAFNQVGGPLLLNNINCQTDTSLGWRGPGCTPPARLHQIHDARLLRARLFDHHKAELPPRPACGAAHEACPRTLRRVDAGHLRKRFRSAHATVGR